jgi:hypothetical protein
MCLLASEIRDENLDWIEEFYMALACILRALFQMVHFEKDPWGFFYIHGSLTSFACSSEAGTAK